MSKYTLLDAIISGSDIDLVEAEAIEIAVLNWLEDSCQIFLESAGDYIDE